ncbi:MgtC/SapB family protein [Aerococcaceae bacterium zg-BR9]|uniref:MgtC/SapB family protein n=1 Tax=Aerococcaceae bacterium zg-1292 TaxID=2774330 RepID=UPI004063B66C|nr:MgtC/SapB family protein [Aerococcaceae bacterium zg-BR9]MBF6977831.1 MgtC/SapB family protein [Aerococcaceae bacterium zg-BR22]
MMNFDGLPLEIVGLRILLSVLLGGVVGIERGVKNQAAGIRTYILVCLASTMVMMVNQFIVARDGFGDPTRMGAQVISGLGFLGAGTILVTENNKIKGLTTAAGLWTSAVIGLAVGVGFYSGALLTTGALLFIMTLFAPLKSYLNKRSKVVDFLIVFESLESFNRVLIYLNTSDIKIIDMNNGLGDIILTENIKLDSKKQVACFMSLKLHEKFNQLAFQEKISTFPGVLYIEQT